MTMDVGRIVKQHFEDHLLELHWKIRNVLAQKNSEIAVHIAEKERLEATNEILGEQIRRNAMNTPTESDHELAEKLNQINIKKKIIDDENVNLKTKLMTIKHEKMRDEKVSSDTISKLSRELKKLRYDLEKKSSVEETMKSFSDQFTCYKKQTQTMIDSLKKTVLDKEEEIKIVKKQLLNKELYVNRQMNNDESNGIKDTVFIKKITELSAESEAILNKIREDEPGTMHIEISEVRSEAMDERKSQEIEKGSNGHDPISFNDCEFKTTDSDSEESVVRGVVEDTDIDESMTSSRLYSEKNPATTKDPVNAVNSCNSYNQNKNFKCPLPKCYTLGNFRHTSEVKYHVAQHFHKIIMAKYPFIKDQPCSFCNSINKTRNDHVYHIGVKHKHLLEIIPDTNEQKEIAIAYLNLENRK